MGALVPGFKGSIISGKPPEDTIFSSNFKNYISNATAEGLNSKIQMVKQTACGFRNREHYRTAIYFHCGGLDLYPR